ncbi:hypothetical protein DMA11_18445, partial [Marinilabiliaceae bacterium JC017]
MCIRKEYWKKGTMLKRFSFKRSGINKTERVTNKGIGLFMVILIFTSGCINKIESSKEFYQNKRDNIRNISGEIVAVELDVIFGRSTIYIVDDILLVVDLQSTTQGIHLFDKNTFKYLASTGKLGKGPGEITRYGHVSPLHNKRAFRMIDHGKGNEMLEFELDSILTNLDYKPKRVCSRNTAFTLAEYDFINDSV